MGPQEEMARAGVGPHRHPFDIFPEEIWPHIAEKLEDSNEILNLIQAIPELHEALAYRRRWWLFDQIIPNVSKFLGLNDVLACRQVCKAWAHGVDNFVENHPTLRAYDHAHQVTGQVWNFGETPRNFPRLFDIRLENQEMVTDFLENLEHHPAPTSQIVGRALSFDFWDVQVVTGALEVISNIGNHVWYLKFYGALDTGPLEFSNFVKNGLVQLPNLKSLTLIVRLRRPRPQADVQNQDQDGDGENIDGGGNEYDEFLPHNWDLYEDNPNEEANPELEKALESVMEQLPPLPHLESLEFRSFQSMPKRLTNALVHSYSHQIRKLTIILVYWKPEYAAMFPNLTELNIIDPTRQGISDILLSIQAPLLYQLYLAGPFTEPLVTETDVLPWLNRFPLLKNLSFADLTVAAPVPGAPILNPQMSSFPSVKFLRIFKWYLNPNTDLLLCFPNLEYLYLDDSWWVEPPECPPSEPTVNILASIESGLMYESNVWELLPKLKGLTLEDFRSEEIDPVGWGIRFQRDIYEHGRRVMAQAEAAAAEANAN